MFEIIDTKENAVHTKEKPVFECFEDAVLGDNIMGKLEELASKGSIQLTVEDYENMSEAELGIFEEEAKSAYSVVFQNYKDLFLEIYWACIEKAVKTTSILHKDALNYKRLKDIFRRHESLQKGIPYSEQTHLTAHIVFTADSFEKAYPPESRTYIVSSDNKAFQDGMGGYSIFGSCLDGTDKGVRLEQYMREENGGSNGWEIEKIELIRSEETAL